MRLLMLGAGATGGYFGGRLMQAGRDVSFLLRPRRAGRVRDEGLTLRSPKGNAVLKPKVVALGKVTAHYDVVFLGCKAYDLASALDAIAPAMGPQTMIVPLLNGMRHLEALDARFGAERVLGGLCSIAVRLADDGAIEHMSTMHLLRFGERDGSRSERVAALEAQMDGVNIDAKGSRNIVSSMWEKWVMLASLAAMNCLMRGDVTTIVQAPGGHALCLQMLQECAAIADAHGHPPREQVLADIRAFVDSPQGAFTASMLRDLEQGGRIEADHIVGDLVARGEAAGVDAPLLRTAYCSLKCYEALRAGRRPMVQSSG